MACRLDRIRAIHAGSRSTYGATWVPAELVHSGARVAGKRVTRLMWTAGLQGVSRRRFVRTTLRDGPRPAPDLAERRFVADRPYALWVVDISTPRWPSAGAAARWTCARR